MGGLLFIEVKAQRGTGTTVKWRAGLLCFDIKNVTKIIIIKWGFFFFFYKLKKKKRREFKTDN